ncbi:MAG: metallophosphoesterase [Roseburia sp.]
MRRGKKWNSMLAAALIVATVGSSTLSVYAGAAPDGATKAEDTAAAANGAFDAWKSEWVGISQDWTQVSMTPGSDETQKNFAWYSKSEDGVPTFIYGKTVDLSDGVSATVVQSDAQTGYKSNKVTLSQLEANTTYYYQVAGKEIESFTTKDSSSFQFVFVGDPQIGSSNAEKAKKPEDIAKDTFKQAQYDSVQSDSFNWANTLKQAMSKTGGDVSFILSAGDQIQTNAKKVQDYTVSEIEYAGYLSPDVLKSVPVATTVGNHDADNENYQYHFNIPNLSEKGSNGIVGGDYWFTYGDALFLMLNTQDTNVADHEAFIKEAVEANPDCNWRVVTLHQDIYGSAEHSNEPEIVNLRYALIPYFEEYDVDVVLTGHDHAYSRSYLLSGDGVKDITYTDDEFDEQLEKDIDVGDSTETLYTAPGNIADDTTDAAEQAYLNYLYSVMDSEAVIAVTKDVETAVNPEGILYMTANSASGSKYYDLVPRMQSYIAARWQEDVPTYSVVSVDETSFQITTYRSDTNEAIDKTFTIIKSVDKSALQSEIEKMEALGLDAEKYTEETYNAFNAALQGAKAVLADDQAKTSEVENALAALKAAYSALKLVETSSEDNSNHNDGTDDVTTNQNGLTEEQTAQTVSQITNAKNGETVIISMGGATVLPKAVLEAAKGKDVILEVQMNNCTWKITGTSITEAGLQDINLQVSQNTNNIPENVISNVAGSNPVVQISLAHNGEFGFTAELTLNVGKDYSGKIGNLYYYNNKGVMEFKNKGTVEENGNVSLQFTHASEYAIVLTTKQAATTQQNAASETKTTATQTGATETVKTGDDQNVAGYIVLVGMAGLIIVAGFASKRRKKNI